MDVTPTLRRLVGPLPLLLLIGCPASQDTADTKTPPPDDTWPTLPPDDPDGDGWTIGDGDCDDANADVHPMQVETCNGADDNCDGQVDEGLGDVDDDGTPDCRDVEDCDGVDNDGDGIADEDLPDTDADGLADCVEVEDCDGLDNDGNGLVDDTVDADGDGVDACADCDDDDAAVYPGALDGADGVDNDCDGLVDDTVVSPGDLVITELLANPSSVADPDGEWIEIYNTTDRSIDLVGFTLEIDGVAEQITASRPIEVAPGAYAVLGGNRMPAENGFVDVAWAWTTLSLQNEGGTARLTADDVTITAATWTAADVKSGVTWLLDGAWLDGDEAGWCLSVLDGDAWPGELGSPGADNELCSTIDHDGDGVTQAEGDCDDADASRSPMIPETWYDGIDTDCAFDDDYDQDHDGATLDADCDDLDATAFPGATEVCDAADVDEDCDGLSDDADEIASPATWYPDVDGDGYGDSASPWTGCNAPATYVEAADDCDDADAAVSPGRSEVCGDGLDNDCDGSPNDCGWSGEITAADTLFDLRLAGSGRTGAVGSSVAWAGDIDADGTTDLVTGAPGDDLLARDGGRVFLTPADATGDLAIEDDGSEYFGFRESDGLGQSVAGGTDLDGDGSVDILVGAAGADEAASGAGSVYMLPSTYGTDGIATDSAIGMLQGANADDAFGTAIALLGDVNGDGFADVAVSAPGADDSFTGGGSVYIFHGPLTGARSSATADATWTGITASDAIGDAIAGGVDLDGDGISEVLIGGKSAGNARPPGGAWLVSGDMTGVISVGDGTATIDGATGNIEAGTSVALLNDINGDGFGELLVGAPLDTFGGQGTGTASLFYGPHAGGFDTADADAVFGGEANGDTFGRAVAAVGDLDHDGVEDFAVGAPQRSNSGAVYLYYGAAWSGSVQATDADARFLASHTSGDFGSQVLGGQDVTGDGLGDLVITGRYDATLGSQAGALFVFAGAEGL